MALLGVDLGSSSIKAVIFGEDGKIVSQGMKSYHATVMTEQTAELDADVLFCAFADAVKQAAEGTDQKVGAMTISSHGESFAAISPQGKEIGNIIMNSDNRAVRESAFLEREFGREKLYAITGIPVHPMFGLMKIMNGMAEGTYDGNTRFLNAGDYILYRLGVEPLTDYSLASRMFGLDLKKKEFNEDILKAAGIGRSQLPDVVQAGTIAGILPDCVCAMLGLPQGVKVVVGGHDQACGALGEGIVGQGAGISAGTYECIVCVGDEIHNSRQALAYSLNNSCHVVPDKYVTLAFYPAGIAVRWLVDEFYGLDRLEAERDGISVYERLQAKVLEISQPTGISFTPHLIGSCNPHWDVRATGALGGITPQATRYHLYKAVYEGIACEMAQNVAALEKIGLRFEECNLSGGGSKSDFTVQLRASLSGKILHKLSTSEAVCQGAAVVAGTGTGVYQDFEAAKQSMVRVEKSFFPDEGQRKQYARQMEQYDLLYQGLKEYRKA